MSGSFPTVGIDPNTFEVLNGHPNKIPTDKILGGVVQNCQMVKIGPSCLGDSNLDETSFSFHTPVGSFLLVIKKMVKIGPSCLGDSNLDEISFLAAGNLAFPPQTLFSRSESCQIEVDLLASGFRASVPGCQ